jgi:hypothetical protein
MWEVGTDTGVYRISQFELGKITEHTVVLVDLNVHVLDERHPAYE